VLRSPRGNHLLGFGKRQHLPEGRILGRGGHDRSQVLDQLVDRLVRHGLVRLIGHETSVVSGCMNATPETTGRRTGRPREIKLYAWPDGDRLVIVGSRGGSARNPAWVHNLRAEPRATLRRGKQSEEVRAREVEGGEERERLWQLVTTAFPLYRSYQRRTARTIPLFVLDPVGAG
jgi:deazaflavin-dependent oxidoreductase (nitroreductase family)